MTIKIRDHTKNALLFTKDNLNLKSEGFEKNSTYNLFWLHYIIKSRWKCNQRRFQAIQILFGDTFDQFR